MTGYIRQTLLAAKADIAGKMCDKKTGKPVAGAAYLSATPIVKRKIMSNCDKCFYDSFVKTFGLGQLPCEESFRTAMADVANLGGKPVCLSATMSMMRSWVDCRVGVAYLHPVALSSSQLESIRTEYYNDYGCTPEESGLSPRGGAMVVELVCDGAEWLAVRFVVICLSALGAERDMQIAKDSIRLIVDSITTLAIPNSRSHGLKEFTRYPEM